MLATSRDTYQEVRNNAGLPGHDASWTRHYTAKQNLLFPAAHSPAPAPAATTHHVSPTAASNAGEGPVTSTDPDY